MNATSTYRCDVCGHGASTVAALWRHRDESPACCGDVVTIRKGSAGAPETVDTHRACVCGQRITVVRDGGGWYSECGGEGEGGCEPWIDGDRDAEAAHESAIALVTRSFPAKRTRSR